MSKGRHAGERTRKKKNAFGLPHQKQKKKKSILLEQGRGQQFTYTEKKSDSRIWRRGGPGWGGVVR